MRTYSIKKGHNPNLGELIKQYFGVEGDVEEGITFETEGIGTVHIKMEGKKFTVDIIPPEKITGSYSVLRNWNDFLFDATGRTAKERKKIMDKEVKK